MFIYICTFVNKEFFREEEGMTCKRQRPMKAWLSKVYGVGKIKFMLYGTLSPRFSLKYGKCMKINIK